MAGLHVSARTRLSVNLWKLPRDPRIWSDPLTFQPERFLIQHASLDVRGRDFELIPFGSGRRSCPGITFALQVLHLTLARLLHSFELGTISNSPVDMTEGPGMIAPKATPLASQGYLLGSTNNQQLFKFELFKRAQRFLLWLLSLFSLPSVGFLCSLH